MTRKHRRHSTARKREIVATTDSNHDSPMYSNVAKGFEVHGPNQLWVGDITYVAISTGFVYLAVTLDTWSRKVAGYGLSRNIDTRLTAAALKAAIRTRRPLPGCVVHIERGTQYAAGRHRRILKEHGLTGSRAGEGTRMTARRLRVA